MDRSVVCFSIVSNDRQTRLETTGMKQGSTVTTGSAI
jgi:hypothetical protein